MGKLIFIQPWKELAQMEKSFEHADREKALEMAARFYSGINKSPEEIARCAGVFLNFLRRGGKAKKLKLKK